jgi:hypothetical protein
MNLMVALAVLAVLVLVALVAHGIWSARRAGPRRAQPESPAAGALASQRVEPALDSEPSPSTQPSAHVFPDMNRPAAARGGRVDALIDAVATLALETPASGELALTHYPPTRRAGTKPFHIEGMNDETGDWELPGANRRYREFQAGVQLANRHGALNEIEYSEFVQKVQAFAEAIGAHPDFPDMLDVVARARELDAFANPHDANLTVHLRANGAAWSVGYLQQAAARHGFVLGTVPGRLVLPASEEGAPAVLQLAYDPQAALAEDPNQAAVRDLTLSLDVPQTPESAAPFAAWEQAAAALATELDAAVVDDRGQPITPQAFAAIGTELEQLYRALEGHDLAAGSAVARRLFS